MTKFIVKNIKMWKHITSLCFSLLFCISIVYAQQGITVTGTVSDYGGTLPGVNVVLKGTLTGVVTDMDGKYEITVPDANAVLVFSFVGFNTTEMVVGAQRIIDVLLTEDAQMIEEVVVVAYGTQKKINLTGAVHSVDVEKTLNNRPIADVGRSLQGTTPGLSIVVPNGEAGSDAVIRIRGQIASINSTASSAPLILLDNVEISSLSLVNPDDIESISVLKDAAASSIYGAKASLGVILITSKKGAKTDQVNVTYSNNFAWSKVAKNIDMAMIDGLEYAMSAMDRVGATRIGAFWAFNRDSYERSKKWVDKYGGKIGRNDPFVFGRDWYVDGAVKMGVRPFDAYEYMVAEWTPTMTHNLSVNGRSGKTGYNIGLGYYNQAGTMKTAKKDNFERYNASARFNTEINQYVTVRTGFLYSQRTKNYPYITNSTTADPWLYIYRWGPLQPFGNDENGNIIRSPASEAAQANTAIRQENYMNLNVGSTIRFTNAWTLDVDYTYDNNQFLWNRPGTRYMAADSWTDAVLKTDENGNQIHVNEEGQVVSATSPGAMLAQKLPLNDYTGASGAINHIRRESENTQRNTFNMYSTYNLKLQSIHDFKFMLGSNIVYSKRQNHWSQRTDLIDINDPQFGKAIGTQTADGYSYWESQVGFFGRVNYVFNNRYLAEANLRYDGSSKFPTSLKWRWFPSFSAGWIVSEEAFMDNLRQIVYLLKIRGSWGVIGDQTVSNTLYVPTMTYYSSGSWLNGTTRYPYFGTPGIADANITWQDFETLNLGVDARFFDGKLGIVFDWFQRTTKNMISVGLTLPSTSGTPSPVGNYSELRTRGVELAIDYNYRLDNGLGLSFMASFSDATTYITDYDKAARQGTSAGAYWKGKRLGDIWGYEVDRLYQKDDFEYDASGNHIKVDVPLDPTNPTSAKVSMNKLKNESVYQPFMQTPANFLFGPGDIKYKDKNGDGRINEGDNTKDAPGDQVVLGNFYSRFQYGFRISADYKGFDLSMFFQGVGKRELWGDGSLAVPGYNASDGAMPQAIAKNFWREDRTNAFYPRPYNIGAVAGGSTVAGNTRVNELLLLNMAYFRLKNITFGYSLPPNILQKVYLSKARIYISLENMLTFDKLNGLPIDPEAMNGYSMWDTSNYNSGRTGVGAPIFKSASVGLQLTF